MEFQKIVNLLDTTSSDKDLPRFVTKNGLRSIINQKKITVLAKKLESKTPMLRSDLCDFSDGYIIVKGIITVINPNNAKRHKAVAFKNNAPFLNCISKINGVQIDNTENLDVIMPMYNLLEYSKNYEKVVCGIITEINQVILFFLALNLLSIRQVLQEILVILVMVKMDMMQAKLVKMKLKLLFH